MVDPRALAANILRQIERLEAGLPLEHVVDRRPVTETWRRFRKSIGERARAAARWWARCQRRECGRSLR